MVRPLRTGSGRLIYGPDEVVRLSRGVILKAAAFSLAEIGRLLDHRTIAIGAMIAAQLEALDARAAELASARGLPLSVKSRVDRGEPLDAEPPCSLIHTGEQIMQPEQWRAVADRYYSPAEKGIGRRG